MNIRKVVTFMANIALTLFLLLIGVFSLFQAIADKDAVMYVAAALSTLAGTCNGYYFGYNHGKQAQDNNITLEEDK